MAGSTIINGATVRLFVNGVPYAKVIDFEYNIMTPQKEIRGCDSAQPFELAPTTTAISGTLSIYRQGMDGAAEGAGLAVPISQISKAKYVSLMLVETRSNTVLFEARRVSVTSQTWRVATRALAVGSISFSSIDYQNEVRVVQ